ncbi:MAG: RNA-guided pseudouridylation complex pseudouridine synthase subunit Cbf5, partial [Methanosarcinales archaeon]|nr:RNA-guided pseudouridylation complex pseudouridine synthase subunit Cbf5 [Methanosarcinales archaeon]
MTARMLPSQQKRSVLVKRTGKTDPAFGTAPDRRPMEMHLRLGAISLDKPAGPTSHEVVAWVERILGIEKAGHSGTLDPNVTGVLPVMLGDATRVVEALLTAGKEYVCLMRIHSQVPRK